MPKIIQLSPHVANLIAAGEVVERPASVVKELLENAVDAGASQVTLEIRDGGMTFLRVTDNGCGMTAEDARTAFLRHATSKLRSEEDLTAIATMGFRGEALAAIASVSRIDLLTKTPGSLTGTSLHLEAGVIQEEEEAGCPDGTTIIVRDLFFNTPARMKFMKSDTVEGSRVASAVQQQALAHPEVAFRFLRDGKQILSTPGTGELKDAMYCVYGRDCARMAEVASRWEGYSLSGYVSLPTDARATRGMQTFFVNNRPVKSRLLMTALEEAYRNQIMVGKFPACVLHLNLPAGAVDVNVHPAKTEVKFLSEKAVFDCVHYGVLAALNKQTDRPEMKFRPAPASAPIPESKAPSGETRQVPPPRKEPFFRTMTPEEFKTFSSVLKDAPQPKKEAAAAFLSKVEVPTPAPLRESVMMPRSQPTTPAPAVEDEPHTPSAPIPIAPIVPATHPSVQSDAPMAPAQAPDPEEMEQTALELPSAPAWRMVGELYNTYILVEEGEDAFLIDKHAAHERILFEKLKANPERISSQALLQPLPVRLSPTAAGELLSSSDMLDELGFEVDEFGENTLLLRQIPMDLSPEDAADALESLASDLLNGRRGSSDTVRDELLHTVACKAAIKAGWHSDEKELLAIAEAVMGRQDLKYCPHGRPICISLSKKQLEKQFKRT